MSDKRLTLTAARQRRLLDHEFEVRDWRSHQLTLAVSAAVFLAGSLVSVLFLPMAALCIQAGSVYALRFRRTGCRFMTRRSLWIGATPVDVRCRYLLDGWHP